MPQAADHFRHPIHHVLHAHNHHVAVRHQRQRAAPTQGIRLQADRARLGRRHVRIGDHRINIVEQSRVGAAIIRGGLAGEGRKQFLIQPLGVANLLRAALLEHVGDGLRQLLHAGLVHNRLVVFKTLNEDFLELLPGILLGLVRVVGADDLYIRGHVR